MAIFSVPLQFQLCTCVFFRSWMASDSESPPATIPVPGAAQRKKPAQSPGWMTARGWELCSGCSISACGDWDSATCCLGTESWSLWSCSSSGSCSGSWASRLWGWWPLCASSSSTSRSSATFRLKRTEVEAAAAWFTDPSGSERRCGRSAARKRFCSR